MGNETEEHDTQSRGTRDEGLRNEHHKGRVVDDGGKEAGHREGRSLRRGRVEAQAQGRGEEVLEPLLLRVQAQGRAREEEGRGAREEVLAILLRIQAQGPTKEDGGNPQGWNRQEGRACEEEGARQAKEGRRILGRRTPILRQARRWRPLQGWRREVQ